MALTRGDLSAPVIEVRRCDETGSRRWLRRSWPKPAPPTVFV